MAESGLASVAPMTTSISRPPAMFPNFFRATSNPRTPSSPRTVYVPVRVARRPIFSGSAANAGPALPSASANPSPAAPIRRLLIVLLSLLIS